MRILHILLFPFFLLVLLENIPLWAKDRINVKAMNLVEFSHHDLGWHKNSFAAESSYTNMEINRALDLMRKYPDFKWTHEYQIYIYEYLKAYPERYTELRQRVAEGRFDMGAGYSQPQTSFITGELLARQFIYGKKWVESMFPGFKSRVYYNTDVPGLGTQMPQILKKAGVDYLYGSRSWNFDGSHRNEFKQWEALDGSCINMFFMHSYCNGFGVYMPPEQKKGIKGNAYIQARLKDFKEDKVINPLLGDILPLVYSWDCFKPFDFSGRIREWNRYAGEHGLPEMRYGTMKETLDSVFAKKGNFVSEKRLKGEWPNKWFYENGASDFENFKNQREAERFLRAAETLAVVRAVLTGSFADYPSAELEEGWRAADMACHGYAPVPVLKEFRTAYKKAYDIAKRLYSQNLEWLIGQIRTVPERGGLSFAVYNTLSWSRDDCVILDPPAHIGRKFRIIDSRGCEVPYQFTDSGKIVFVAKSVPSMGYATYYIQKGISPSRTDTKFAKGAVWTGAFSNRFYTLSPAPGGGLETIIDRTNGNKSLFDTEKFKIGELYDFTYNGMGAGEQLHISQPHHGISQIGKFAGWRCVESGPVRTVFETRAAMTSRGPATLRLTAYENLKKIDFDMRMECVDRAVARQVRMMFPVRAGSIYGTPSDDGYSYIDQTRTRVSYEVPFGSVTVGNEVLPKFSKYNDQSSPNSIGGGQNSGNLINEGTRPREVQNWIRVSDRQYNTSLTLSSYNLGWDYQDATRLGGRDPLRTPVLQPVLFSTAACCHGDGYIWLQPGEHRYHFSMTSGIESDTAGALIAIAANNPLDARIIRNRAADAALPEIYSAISLDRKNVMVTAVKKAEDDMRNIVLRYYECEGRGRDQVKMTLSGNRKIVDAREVNLIECESGVEYAYDPHAVTLPVAPWSIGTVRISLEGMEDRPMPVGNLLAYSSKKGFELCWNPKSAGAVFEVEYRRRGGEWIEAAKTDQPAISIPLPRGEYQFRVRVSKGNRYSTYTVTPPVMNWAVILPIKITASNYYPKQPASLVGDRSGMSSNDPHGVHNNASNGNSMWLSGDNPKGRVWLQFDFGKRCTFGKTYIWNYNQSAKGFRTLHQASLNYIQIFYTRDGKIWKLFKNKQCVVDTLHPESEGWFKLAPGTGRSGMNATNLASGEVLDFGGLEACSIRFEIPNRRNEGNYGWYVEPSRNNYGVSEIMFSTPSGEEEKISRR